MSISQPPGGFGGPPAYPNPAGGPAGEQSRPPPPTLPSMSSLLNHEPPAHEPQHSQHLARQFQPPYNMTKQPHPLFLAQMDPNAPVQHIYHPPPPPVSSHHSQGPQEPMLMPLHHGQHTLARPQNAALPSPPRRQSKPIKKRKADQPKDRDQGFQSEYPPQYNPSESNLSPTQHSFEQEGSSYSRRESTFSDTSSRRMSSQTHSTKAMPISGLLSEQQSTRSERPSATYSLRMRQQPVAARACGFGERDRRVIDPPPILQMTVTGPHLSLTDIGTMIRSPFSVVHCTLWDPDTDTDATAMPGTTDKRQQRRLMGTLVASPFVGKDEHGVEGCFFTFPDLSVRTPGRYSLRFAMVILDPTRMGPGASEPVRSTIWSSDFQVFNAKDFGGMRASTALTKTLKHQGCLISVKKGNSKSGGNARDDDEDDDDDDDDEGESSLKRGKRSKR